TKPQDQSFQKTFSQGFQGKTFIPFQGQKQQFSNFQAPASSGSTSQDELKGMMQQLMANQQKC
ncbi:hypothetical protein, partial [Escherichia coli]|uniref:hypothetical protein n=1 Tax=Escherichia coli TaxID=562 RepID=UPI001C57A02A